MQSTGAERFGQAHVSGTHTWALYNNKTLETQTPTPNMTLTLGYLILTTLAYHLDDSGTNG